MLLFDVQNIAAERGDARYGCSFLEANISYHQNRADFLSGLVSQKCVSRASSGIPVKRPTKALYYLTRAQSVTSTWPNDGPLRAIVFFGRIRRFNSRKVCAEFNGKLRSGLATIVFQAFAF
jgi:hypothetical protein